MKITDDIRRAMEAAGLDPSRLKAPRGKKAKSGQYPPPCSWEFAPGILLAHFEVAMRPVPWKAPTVTRNGVSFKDASLKRWQQEVRECGSRAMGPCGPHSCPVDLVMDFHLAPRPGSPPDVSNLSKSTEDSLQGPVIVNDRQVRKITARKLRSDRDFAEIWVYSASEGT